MTDYPYDYSVIAAHNIPEHAHHLFSFQENSADTTYRCHDGVERTFPEAFSDYIDRTELSLLGITSIAFFAPIRAAAAEERRRKKFMAKIGYIFAGLDRSDITRKVAAVVGRQILGSGIWPTSHGLYAKYRGLLDGIARRLYIADCDGNFTNGDALEAILLRANASLDLDVSGEHPGAFELWVEEFNTELCDEEAE